MPWHAHIVPGVPVIETSYSGVLSAQDVAAAIEQTLALVRAHGITLLLADCTTLEGGHSIVDLFSFVQSIASAEGAESLKEALLLPGLAAAAQNVRFWETACVNRGINSRIFSDRSSALEWLLA
jgi:hypothetical protein